MSESVFFVFFFNPEIVLQNCRYFIPDCTGLHLLSFPENYEGLPRKVKKKCKDIIVADVIYVEHL